jgi:hypothetical protein
MKKPSNKQKSNSDSFDPAKHEEVREFTNKTIQTFLHKKLQEKSDRRKDIEALNHTVQEFLNSFIILGYTEEGEPVNIISAHNQQEADSLATLVNKFFINCNSREDS